MTFYFLAGPIQLRYYSFMVVWIALGIAFLVPLAFLWFLRKFDLYQTGQFKLNLVTLGCGMIAYWFAAQINPAMVNAGWVTWDQVIRITAPILEEILKAIILISLVQRADFNYVVDGALYGFGAGIGFAIIENVEYVTGNPEIALTVAIARVFSTNLVHATASGLIGTALAYRRGDSSWRGWLAIAGGYVVSMGLHMIFNTMVSAGAFLVVAILFGLTGMALIWYVIKRGLTIQKEWVAEKLNMADRATKQETKVVSRIETIEEILSPVEKRFGLQTASLVRTLVYKQAQIGIKRKLLETTASQNKTREINKIIEELVRETNELRNQIGVYCMMMVRTVYLEQDLRVWNLLNARVAAAGLSQKGGGLWDRVNDRLQQQSSQEDKS
ncbi:MAG: PrsW family intramembrane metalloprotease [Chloroflexi bacterium]|nr:PrsW family intramembrane metalloprotease [Chloroflexota bacterium]